MFTSLRIWWIVPNMFYIYIYNVHIAYIMHYVSILYDIRYMMYDIISFEGVCATTVILAPGVCGRLAPRRPS